MPIKHKYRARPKELDGMRFASQAEARHYQKLKIAQQHGDLVMFLMQVPIHLPGKTKYVCDFVEFWAPSNGEEAGEVRFVDVKGVETQTFKLKKRQVEELYPIEIIVVKGS